MEIEEHKEFDKAVNSKFRRIKEGLSDLWSNAKDKNYADQHRVQVIVAGLIAYDDNHNRNYISQFDKNYRLGESIDETIAAITTQVSQQHIEYVPDDIDEDEYMTRFRQLMPTVILSNRRNILGINVNEIGDTAVTRTFFVELYALRKLNDLYQERNNQNTVIEQIEWLGTQKQLAELHIELKAKGWIENLRVNTIQAAYTNSATLDQVMKRNESVKNGEEVYDQIYTPRYKPMFYGIKANLKEK